MTNFDDKKRDGFKRDDSKRDDFKRDGFKGGDFKRDGFKGGDFKRDGFKGGDFKRDDFKRDGFKGGDFKKEDLKCGVDAFKDIVKVFVERGLDAMEFGFKEFYVRLSRGSGTPLEGGVTEVERPTLSIKSIAPETTSPKKDEESSQCETEYFVTSPCVGTAFLAPSPEAEPFTKPGARVEKGQSLLIVEAMKVMNTIPSPVSGIVKEILVKDEQPVEFGQKLVQIECD